MASVTTNQKNCQANVAVDFPDNNGVAVPTNLLAKQIKGVVNLSAGDLADATLTCKMTLFGMWTVPPPGSGIPANIWFELAANGGGWVGGSRDRGGVNLVPPALDYTVQSVPDAAKCVLTFNKGTQASITFTTN